jgi:hypothetical protein
MSAFDRAKEAAEEAVDRVKEEISDLTHHKHDHTHDEGEAPPAIDLIEDNRGGVEPDHYNS